MYLKSLEINGFKSFAQKGHFDFTSQISGIVGPNGSGKSNVAEAFRFVLGEQSLKNMRSKKGTDLIFAGKSGQMNRARVAVAFDNSQKKLDIDYQEVVLERIVLRDGTNEYFINKNKVRAKDVAELLAAANIGSSGHHIISQGEADKILMISPRERKQVIEEAMGLKVYTIKKNESVRKLARTQEHLHEVKQEERATTPRLNYLKREVEKVERARALREELRHLYRGYFPAQSTLVRDLAEGETQEQELSEEITTLQKEISRKSQEMLDTTSAEKKRSLEADASRLGQELRTIRSQKNDAEREAGRIEAVIEIERAKQKRCAESTNKPSSPRREQLAAVVHTIWQEWVRGALGRGGVSNEERTRLQARMGTYEELAESDKDLYRQNADTIMRTLGDGQTHERVFDPTVLEQSLARTGVLSEQMQLLTTREQTLQAKLDETEQQLASPELASQKIKISILEIEKQLAELQSQLASLLRSRQELSRAISVFETEAVYAHDLYGKEAEGFKHGSVSEDLNIHEKIIRTRALLDHAGSTSGEEVFAEYTELQQRSEYIKEQVQDLEASRVSLESLITELEREIEERFRQGMTDINSSFAEFFQTLFNGGQAELVVVNVPVGKSYEEELQEYELGVDMQVQLPNKKISSLSMLSGGERSLTSIALLFAMSQVSPPPFIILDETDAALDEANSKRYGDMVEKLAEHSQLIVITHNRETMARSGILYGVTMGDDGVSRLLSVSLEEAEAVAK